MILRTVDGLGRPAAHHGTKCVTSYSLILRKPTFTHAQARGSSLLDALMWQVSSSPISKNLLQRLHRFKTRVCLTLKSAGERDQPINALSEWPSVHVGSE